MGLTPASAAQPQSLTKTGKTNKRNFCLYPFSSTRVSLPYLPQTSKTIAKEGAQFSAGGLEEGVF